MITAFNTTLIGLGRGDTCRQCPDTVGLTECDLEKGKRMRRNEHPILRTKGDVVAIYTGGDAVSATCIKCRIPQYCGAQPTPVDGKYGVFMQDGNVFARMQDGRQDQMVEIWVDIVLASGKLVKGHRVVSMFNRPYVSDCLQKGRDYKRKPQPVILGRNSV